MVVIIPYLLALYFGIGLLSGIFFLAKGAERLDPLIKGSKRRVRLLLLPGAILTWVIWLPRVIKSSS